VVKQIESEEVGGNQATSNEEWSDWEWETRSSSRGQAAAQSAAFKKAHVTRRWI